VAEVRRLPPASALVSSAHAVIDATGRAAAWSRPVVTDSHDVARQFEGPPHADIALRMVQGDRWWAYRLGTASTTWAGVVTAGGDDLDADRATADHALRRLGLDPGEMVPRGRRAARVQRALHPVDGRRIAVGDAALAHDPVAGAGIRFALASAIAAATVVANWADDRHDVGAAYYTELVTGEHGRHLDALRAIHGGGSDATRVAEAAQAGPPPDVVHFTAPIVETPLAIDGLIQPGLAVRLPDGTLTRWLGSFDLLCLARLSSDPIPRIVLLARLQAEGLAPGDARAVLTWALRHRLLAA